MQVPDIERPYEEAQRALAAGRPVVVLGPDGSGRGVLTSRFQMEGATVFASPPLADADAAGALTTLIARAVGAEIAVDNAGRPEQSLREAVSQYANTLVVRLRGDLSSAGSPREREGALQAVLDLLREARKLVLVCDRPNTAAGLHVAQRIQLTQHKVALTPEIAPSLSEAFEALGAREHGRFEASPIAWRVAAASVALGGSAAAARVHAGRDLSDSVQCLVRHVLWPVVQDDPSAVTALRRLIALRAPMPEAQFAAYLGLDGEQLTAFRDGLAYGSPVGMHSVVRRAVECVIPSTPPMRPTTPAAPGGLHAEAAAAWKQLDGATGPAALDLDQTTAWLERMHHLAEGGTATLDEWQTLEKPCPSFYWDNGRSLSQKGEYAQAALVFGECVQRFPNDDYATHYRAFNLERTGALYDEVAPVYERAVALNAENPWWNGRRVTYLIKTGRARKARVAWHAFRAAVDPDGSRALQDPWLAAHVHVHVAEAWLAVGHWNEAYAVLSLIPTALQPSVDALTVGRAAPPVHELQRQIDSARERDLQSLEQQWEALEDPAMRALAQDMWIAIARHAARIACPIVRVDDEDVDAPELEFVWSHAGLTCVAAFSLGSRGVRWSLRDHVRQRSLHGVGQVDDFGADDGGWEDVLRRIECDA